jgi:hypothetical protein
MNQWDACAQGVTCSLYPYSAAVCHQDAFDPRNSFPLAPAAKPATIERREESAGTANDYWDTGTVQSGCKQGCHQTTSGVIWARPLSNPDRGRRTQTLKADPSAQRFAPWINALRPAFAH